MEHENLRFCKSLAGHDKGTVYIIIKEENDYVYVVDGKYKKLQAPKRKNVKHIECVSSIYSVFENVNIPNGKLRDEDIRKAIKLFKFKLKTEVD